MHSFMKTTSRRISTNCFRQANASQKNRFVIRYYYYYVAFKYNYQ